jgi:hypothetical protein
MHNFNLKNLFYEFKTSTLRGLVFLFSPSQYYVGGHLFLLQDHPEENSIFERNKGGNIKFTDETSHYQQPEDFIKNDKLQSKIVGEIKQYYYGLTDMARVIYKILQKLNELNSGQKILKLQNADVFSHGNTVYLSVSFF